MTGEMRAAEDLVRELAPGGRSISIPEPLAQDESAWFLTAVDKGLVEFRSCSPACERTGTSRRDHFDTERDHSHHLFEQLDHDPRLRRELLPCIAAYARAVLDLGYDADRARLLQSHPIRRFRGLPGSVVVRSDAELGSTDGDVHVQIKALPDRQQTRRLAAALDANGTLSSLSPAFARELQSVAAVDPQYLWLVGPNSVHTDRHVFGVRVTRSDVRFRRVGRLPAPV